MEVRVRRTDTEAQSKAEAKTLNTENECRIETPHPCETGRATQSLASSLWERRARGRIFRGVRP